MAESLSLLFLQTPFLAFVGALFFLDDFPFLALLAGLLFLILEVLEEVLLFAEDLFLVMLLSRAWETALPSSSSDNVASLEWSEASSDSQEDEDALAEELAEEDSFSVVL